MVDSNFVVKTKISATETKFLQFRKRTHTVHQNHTLSSAERISVLHLLQIFVQIVDKVINSTATFQVLTLIARSL